MPDLRPPGAAWWRDPRLGLALLVIAVLLLSPQPYPAAIPAGFAAAQAATRAGDYAAAADALKAVAARLPYDGYVLYRAGLADISARRFESAIQYLRASAALSGWTSAKRVALGDAYLGAQDQSAALAEWETALDDLPQDTALLSRLASAYEAEGKLEAALNVLDRLAGMQAADPAVHYRRALLTAALRPDDAPARLAFAAGLQAEQAGPAGLLGQAIEEARPAADPAYTFARVGFVFVQLQEWGLAEAALARAVELNPAYADAHAYLGLARDSQGKDGLPAIEQALALAPDSALAKFFLGLHWRRAGQPGLAIQHLKEAQALDPQNPAIAAEIGGAYASLRDLVNAEEWLTQAVQLAPRSADFWLLLARFYIENEYHVEDPGLPAARMAVGLAPNNAAAVDTLGYALVLTGDAVNGEKTLERAVALDPTLPSAFYHLGVLYASQGKQREAQAALNHVLELDQQGIYGGLALRALAFISP